MNCLIFGFLFQFFASAERFEGTVDLKNGVGFLGKFCFDVNHESDKGAKSGEFSLTLETTNTNFSDGAFIMLFDDEESSWPSVYNHDDISCPQVQEKAINWDRREIYRVDDGWIHSNGKYTFNLPTNKITQNIRPRWWYFTVINCRGPMADVSYSMHAWQLQTTKWDKEFGTNEAGLNTLNLVFFFFYVIFLGIHTVGTRKLGKQLEYTHPLVKLFYAILVLQTFVVTARMFHYGIFAQNGWGVPGFAKFAEVIEVIVRVGFLIILMLLAKGWTINPGEINGKKWIFGSAFLFMVVDVAILFWNYAVQDPAATNIPVGLAFMFYVTLVLWFIWCFVFVYVIYSSWSTEDNPVKKDLFTKIGLLYFPWFFGLPFITLLQFALSPWIRAKVIATMTLLISTAGYCFLAFLLWPTRAEDYFTISAPDPMSSGVENYEQL